MKAQARGVSENQLVVTLQLNEPGTSYCTGLTDRAPYPGNGQGRSRRDNLVLMIHMPVKSIVVQWLQRLYDRQLCLASF